LSETVSGTQIDHELGAFVPPKNYESKRYRSYKTLAILRAKTALDTYLEEDAGGRGKEIAYSSPALL